MQRVIIWSFCALVALAVGSATLFAITARGGTWDSLLAVVRGRCTYHESGHGTASIGGRTARSLQDSLVRIPDGYRIIDHEISIPRGTMLREAILRDNSLRFDGGLIDAPRRADGAGPTNYEVAFLEERGVRYIVAAFRDGDSSFDSRGQQCATAYADATAPASRGESTRANGNRMWTATSFDPMLSGNVASGFLTAILLMGPMAVLFAAIALAYAKSQQKSGAAGGRF